MDNHAMEFLFERHIKEAGILFHTLGADKDIARDDIPRDIVESDDVGVSIVIEISAVNVDEVVVVAEKVVHLPYPLAMGSDDIGNPIFHLFGIYEVEMDVLGGKRYGHGGVLIF